MVCLSKAASTIDESAHEYKSYIFTEIAALNELRRDGHIIPAITGAD